MAVAAREPVVRAWTVRADDDTLRAVVQAAAPGEAVTVDTTGDSIFNATWTTLGVPAITLPAGVGPAGLPLGLQLTGRRWADADLLTLAAWTESALG